VDAVRIHHCATAIVEHPLGRVERTGRRKRFRKDDPRNDRIRWSWPDWEAVGVGIAHGDDDRNRRRVEHEGIVAVGAPTARAHDAEVRFREPEAMPKLVASHFDLERETIHTAHVERGDVRTARVRAYGAYRV